MDPHKNGAVSTVAVAPNPGSSGVTLTVRAGHGSRFPALTSGQGFDATVWAAGTIPFDPTSSEITEIVRVTGVTGDVLTIQRTRENTLARTIVVGDYIAETLTTAFFDAIEADIVALQTATSGGSAGLPLASSDPTKVPFQLGTSTATLDVSRLLALHPSPVQVAGFYSASVGEMVDAEPPGGGGLVITAPLSPSDGALFGVKHGGAAGVNVAVTFLSPDTIIGGATQTTLNISGHCTIFQYRAATNTWMQMSMFSPNIADGRYGGQLQYKDFPGDVTPVTNSTTLASAIQVAVEANSTYEIRGLIAYRAAAAADLKIGLLAPAAATATWTADGLTSAQAADTNLGPVYRQPRTIAQTAVVAGVGTTAGTDDLMCIVSGILRVGGAAGIFGIQMAQNVADASAVTMIAGSSLLCRKIN